MASNRQRAPGVVAHDLLARHSPGVRSTTAVSPNGPRERVHRRAFIYLLSALLGAIAIGVGAIGAATPPLATAGAPRMLDCFLAPPLLLPRVHP